MGKYYYRIFGLQFESELELFELSQETFKSPDIQIKIGKIPTHLPVINRKGVLYETSSNDFLFRINSVGAYRVQNGRIITIEPTLNAILSEICIFLYGSIMGALLHQRGLLPLHGSSVEINKCAISIIGNSSVGKSSLAAGFLEKGFGVISDDISVLKGYNETNIFVQPGLPYLKLWEDVLKHMDSSEELDKVRPKINKYIKPLNQAFCKEQVPLKLIICLERKNSLGFSHEVITGAQKFNLLKRHTYRYQYLIGMSKMQNHFKQTTALSEQIPLMRVKRPESPLMINELTNYIIEQVL